MNKSLAIIILVCAVGATASSQRMSGKDLLLRCQKTAEGVEDYVADLDANLDMENVRMPRMMATMYFKSPDKYHFESPSFAMLPREGFGTPVSLLLERYDATWKAEETIDGMKTSRLLLVAKEPATRLQQLTVWVNMANSTIVRTEAAPFGGRSVSIEFMYALQSGRYWLPEQVRVKLSVPPRDTVDTTGDQNLPGGQPMRNMRGAMRNGTITIRYANYRINTGLPDSLFQTKKMEQP